MTVSATETATARPRSLQRHAGWLATGHAVSAAGQWGVLAATAKLGSPVFVGRLALGLAVAVPITLLTGLQLRSLQATDARSSLRFSDVMTLRLVAAGLGLLLVGLVAVLGPWSNSAALIIVLVGLAKTIDGVSEVCHGVLQRHERHEVVARSLLLQGPLRVGGVAVGLALTGSVEVGALGLIAAGGLVLGLYDLPSVAACMGGTRALVPRWHGGELRRLARTAFPLGVIAMLVSFTPYIPRYALEQYMGEYDVGVFAALASLVGIGTTFVSALGQAATPRLARSHATGDREGFVHLTVRLMGAGLALGVMLMVLVGVAGGPLLTALYTREYAHHTDVLLVLAASGAVGYVASFLGYAVTAGLSFRPQVPLFLLVTAVMVLGCQILVSTHGLAGAAWATFGAMAIQAVGLGILWMRVVPGRTRGRNV